MSAALHFIRAIAILCGLVLIGGLVGGNAAMGQVQTLSPAAQQLADRVKDADTRKDWGELKKIGEEVIARNPKVWSGWYWKGLGHFNLREFPEAIASFKETVALNPNLALGWNNLGAAYVNIGDSTNAIEALEKAAQADPKLAVAWFNLWVNYNAIGNREKVRDAYLRLKDLDPERTKQAIAKYGLPEEPPPSENTASTEIAETGNPAAIREALSKLEAADALISQERVTESLPLLEAAYRVLTANLGAGSEEALRARDYLVFAYADLYRLGDALALTGTRNYKNTIVRMRQIHQQRVAKYGERSEPTIRAATALAYALEMSGEYAEAQQVIAKNYATSMELLGEDHRATLTAALVKQGMYTLLGQTEEAISIGERLVSVSRNKYAESDPLTMVAIAALGSSYVAGHKPSAGIPYLEKALELYSKSISKNNRQALLAMSSLGLAYAASGRPDEALKMAEQAAQLSEATFGKDSPDTASSLLMLGGGYMVAKRLTDSNQAISRALAIYSKSLGPNHPITLTTKTMLAVLHAQRGRRNEAIGLLEEGVRSIEALRLSSDFSPEERQSFFARFASYYRLYALLLATTQPDESFRIGELSKARTLLESTAMRRANDSGLISEVDALKVRDFETRIGDVNDRIANVSVNRSLKATLEAEKGTLIHDFAEFRADLIKRNPKYGQLSDVRIIGAQEGRKILPDDAVFLSYLETSGTMLVFALDKANGLVAKGIPQVSGLKEKLEKYRALLADPDSQDSITDQPSRNLIVAEASRTADPRSLQELSDFFGKTLLDPFAVQIRGKSRVIISPDGPLALIPFETLLFDGKPLVVTHDVSYAQSLSMLSLLKDRKTEYKKIEHREDLFAMGGATYSAHGMVEQKTAKPAKGGFLDGLMGALSRLPAILTGNTQAFERNTEQAAKIIATSRGDRSGVQRAFEKLEANWQNLPGSEEEVKGVAEIFGLNHSLVLTRADASEQMLQELNQKQQLRRYKHLLFSTHGYLSTSEPALSSIVLSQINKTPAADGFVTASEWPSYDLNSDLVFLSACETGLGKVIQGEGVLGLPFALFVAGNTNTVITLWSILDDSTSIFVQKFFKKVKGGMSESVALSQTKREFIQDKEHGRPVFWAPFVMYGY